VTGGSDAALTTTTTYSRFADGGFSVTSTKSNTNEVSRSFQDVFGRTTKSTTKGFAVNSWISKSMEYDFLGRKTRESEPYFDSNPTTVIGSGTKWNTVDYDYLSRPIGQLSYNGRTQTILYDGLSTTTIDGPKTMKVTVDANGNKTELLDNSEKITFTYYANGTNKPFMAIIASLPNLMVGAEKIICSIHPLVLCLTPTPILILVKYSRKPPLLE
jgi:hypothetical protein